MDTAKLPPKTRRIIESVRSQLIEKGYPAPEPHTLLEVIVADVNPDDIVVDIIEFLNANDPEDHPEYQRELDLG